MREDKQIRTGMDVRMSKKKKTVNNSNTLLNYLPHALLIFNVKSLVSYVSFDRLPLTCYHTLTP